MPDTKLRSTSTMKSKAKSSEQRFRHVNATSHNSYSNIIFTKLVTRDKNCKTKTDFVGLRPVLSEDRQCQSETTSLLYAQRRAVKTDNKIGGPSLQQKKNIKTH